MKMVKELIWLLGQASLPVLAVIMVSMAKANAAWISYSGNQGVIVTQQAVASQASQTVTRQPQIIHRHKSPPPLNLPQVKLVKWADTSRILPGGTITYTVTATNEGTNTITNITLIDAIPSYTTFLDATGSGTITYNDTPPVTHVQWVLGEITPSGVATFVLKVRVK
jgi:uncharacterized repeat protein (TIGR01451 family)